MGQNAFFFLQFKKKKDCILLCLGVGIFIYQLIFGVIQNQSLFFFCYNQYSINRQAWLHILSRCLERFFECIDQIKKRNHSRKIVSFIPNLPIRRWSDVLSGYLNQFFFLNYSRKIISFIPNLPSRRTFKYCLNQFLEH